ncbi:beta-ketoacyl-ACP synthase III [Pseudoleptotrichia goodfellowii]|jgi:3-oxoacyl-[acyl-carrier-protein] synthase 3|uniref:Beta-ketoacyl-[acyl-carrier-protein] synthase III n=1 Tax=Pseudoleptotrichia goodfellowii F0264 TaxID=596323 RepID=D0GJ68_9FUSO|nr:beta-ketoacyl-ACP synthase III [Pseudoleptotrichia goodfellowii]EEY35859.1 beta-ketoacyl-acyl-carrier-protein synthase III [Pseudoleptotrichia goodfellowii F0264]
MRVGILGTGSYLPEKVMTNDDLSKFVDTNDEWIRTRTGIRERRIAAENEATSDLAYKAAEKAIENAKIDKNEIDLVIVATMSPDHITPATAAIVQDKLGINAAAFDLSAACTGFVYAFTTGYSFVKSGIYKKVLVIGAETMSRILDWEDRTTCVLFGDGAGAVVLGQIENGGYIASHLVSDGSGAEDVIIPAGGSRNPVSKEEIDKREIYFKMKGSDVFKFAVRAFPETVENVLAQGNTTADDVDMFIPHQANIRIIESIAKRFKQPLDKFYVNLQRYGNTSGASIPLALDEANKEGKLKKGDKVVMVGFGGGLTYGSILLEWSI